jgi:CheY-like chemotaxis protein
MAKTPDRPVILLAEDDPDQAFLARRLLERHGFVVVTALDGEQALTLADVVHPHAIVLDLVMPGLDGFGVLKAMRERGGRHPPVVAVSSLRDYLPKAKELGAADVMRKPYSGPKLVRSLSALMAGASDEVPPPEVEDEVGAAAEIDGVPTNRDERRRATAVEEILSLIGGREGPPDPLLQELTERTARIFDVRACVVSLVTEVHDVWVAGCGVPGAPGKVLPRGDSVCTHAVSSRAALVVHDTDANPFFRNGSVRKMGLRFYAGVPLMARSGETLGTFCVLDHRPRPFGRVELELLSALARAAVGAIEWRERAAHPDEPASTFRHLDTVDPELRILGRDGFDDVLHHLADRAAEHPDLPEDHAAMVVIEARGDRLGAILAALKEAFPVAFFGRLGRTRVGIVAVGIEVDTARRLTLAAVGDAGRSATADVSAGAPAADTALRRVEASVADPGY